MPTYEVPIAIKSPGMEAVGIGILPKNGVYSTNVCSSEGFPAAVDAFMDLFSLMVISIGFPPLTETA